MADATVAQVGQAADAVKAAAETVKAQAPAAVEAAKAAVPETVKDAFQGLLLDALKSAHEGLDATKTGISHAVDFVQAQAPEVIRELLIWNAVSSAFWSFLGVLMIVLSAVWWKRSWKATVREDAPIILLNIVGIGFGLMLAVLNYEWLEILVAPKLWLLEYAAHLIQSAKPQ